MTTKRFYDAVTKVEFEGKQLEVCLDMSTYYDDGEESIDVVNINSIYDLTNRQDWSMEDITLNEKAILELLEPGFDNIEFIPVEEGEDDESWKYAQ